MFNFILLSVKFFASTFISLTAIIPVYLFAANTVSVTSAEIPELVSTWTVYLIDYPEYNSPIREAHFFSYKDCEDNYEYDIIRNALYSNELENLHFQYLNYVCKDEFKIMDLENAFPY